MTLRCVICQKGPMDGVTVHRINAKGVPGRWACTRHLSQTDGPPIAEDTKAIMAALGQKVTP